MIANAITQVTNTPTKWLQVQERNCYGTTSTSLMITVLFLRQQQLSRELSLHRSACGTLSLSLPSTSQSRLVERDKRLLLW